MMSGTKTICLGFAVAAVVAAAAGAGEDAKKPAGAKAPDPFNWGEAVAGLQLGLVPAGRGDTPELRNVYFEGESLKFALFMKNAGEAELTLLHAALFLPDFQVTIAPKDGGKAMVARYDPAELPKDPARAAAPVRVSKGSYGSCDVELDSRWRFEPAEGGAPARKALPVGKYTLQVVYQPRLAKDETGWQGKALTGSVDIEVRVRPVTRVVWPGGGRSGGGGGGVPAPRPRPPPRPGPPTM